MPKSPFTDLTPEQRFRNEPGVHDLVLMLERRAEQSPGVPIPQPRHAIATRRQQLLAINAEPFANRSARHAVRRTGPKIIEENARR